ncbi:hypothetical protein T492DRAFT_930918 [Pavlovales sp. CCMP2436]|nr:hypothetical protein T492DRAFT_930918 [Pavlovales sp. CCMP2436]
MRYDAYVITPLQLAPFEKGPVYLDTRCCAAGSRSKARAYVAKACKARGLGFGYHARFVTACQVRRFTNTSSGPYYTKEGTYYTNDWFFAAPSSIVESWLEMATNWEAQTCWANMLGIKSTWSHYRWMVHLHDGLNATSMLRFTTTAHVMMGRSAYKQGMTLTRVDNCSELASDPLTLFRVGGERDYALAEFQNVPVLPEVAIALGYSTRFAAMARQCPLAELASELSARRQRPLYTCSSPPVSIAGALAVPVSGFNVPLCQRMMPRGGRGVAAEEQLLAYPDYADPAWSSASHSLAHARGRKLFAALRPLPEPPAQPRSELQFNPRLVRKCGTAALPQSARAPPS